MAIGLNADTEYLRRSSIPGGGAGTLTDGAFANTFVGVWVYRPTSGNSYSLSSDGPIIHGQAGAREIKLGYDNTFGGGQPEDPLLHIIFDSGGGAGSTQTFSSKPALDTWAYYFYYETGGTQYAGWIPLTDLTTSGAVTLSRANSNAGSQYINTLTIGNNSGASAVVMGHYAYARARYDSSITLSDVVAWASSTTTDTGDWGFWPLDDSSDSADDSGNSRSLTLNGTLSTETSPNLSSGVSGSVARTNANDTSAASGTTTIVGTLARSNGADTSAGSGTTTVVGTLARTNASDTSAASGSVGSPVSGTLATTNADDTSAATGTTTVTGTLARTNAADTSAATGTTTVTGTLARTNANDTSVASGSSGSAVSGSLATTNASDTSAAAGTTTVTGALATTNGADTSAGAGTTTVVGTLAQTNASDAAAGQGSAGIVSGTVSATNAGDTANASGVATQPAATGGGGGSKRRRKVVLRINGQRYVGLPEDFEQIAERVAEAAPVVETPAVVVELPKDERDAAFAKEAAELSQKLEATMRRVQAIRRERIEEEEILEFF
jgi:hypothetical protein